MTASDPGIALMRAVADWLAATSTPSAVTAAVVDVSEPGHGGVQAKLTPGQAQRLTHLLAEDTALIAGHAATATGGVR